MKKSQPYQNFIDRQKDAELIKMAELAEDQFIEKIAVALAPMVKDAVYRAFNDFGVKLSEDANDTEAQAPATSALHSPDGDENSDMVSEITDPSRDANTVRAAIGAALESGDVKDVHELVQSAKTSALAEDYAGIALGLIDGYIMSGDLSPDAGAALKAELRATLDAALSAKGTA
jgi:hypothetical protein